MTTNEMHDIQTHHITLSVSDGTTMPAYVARPMSAGTHPGLLVFQEAFGVNAHIRDVTERFARAGYTAVAPALFHRTDPAFDGSYTDFSAVMPHMQAVTDENLIVDIHAAYDWLVSDDGGQANAVGSVGYCLGGRVSFLADSLVPLKASASYYGGGIAPNPRRPDLLGRAPDLHAPILLIWGGKDDHIPIDQTRAVEDALRAEGKAYEQITFSEADHGFFCDARASYHPDAAKQAWALTLEFFAAYL
jgi:carboxymethylenebutenolidase